PLLFFSRSAHPPDLLPFPTRRSSDLFRDAEQAQRPLRPEDVRCAPRRVVDGGGAQPARVRLARHAARIGEAVVSSRPLMGIKDTDRKSTRLNSSHSQISYAVFCLKKK